MNKQKDRYILVRGYYKVTPYGNLLTTEEIDCKTVKEAQDLASILTTDEKILSYIFDNINHLLPETDPYCCMDTFVVTEDGCKPLYPADQSLREI